MLAGCYLIVTGQATPENFVQKTADLRVDFGLSGASPDTQGRIEFVRRFATEWLRERGPMQLQYISRGKAV